MKKKIIQIILVILLLLFSFYYTNKSIELVRRVDPIMQEIISSKDKYKVKSIDAKIVNNKMIPGINGIQVDEEKSYLSMKQYGAYNEILMTFKETKPTISVDNNYDKFIIKGNDIKKEVALVFKLNNTNNIENIISILRNKKVPATLFIDGLLFENNSRIFKDLGDFELELLSYDNKYNEIYFTESMNYLSSITNRPLNFCYADYDSKEVIDLCSKLKLHTIIPTIKIGNYPYQEIKKTLENGAIIYLPNNTTTEIELNTFIDYIKQRGYTLVTLIDLLSEEYEK